MQGQGQGQGIVRQPSWATVGPLTAGFSGSGPSSMAVGGAGEGRRSRSQSTASDGSDGSSLDMSRGRAGAGAGAGAGGVYDMYPSNIASGSGSGSAGNGTFRPSTSTGGSVQARPHALLPLGSGSTSISGQAQGQAKGKKKRDAEGKRRKVAKACLVCQRSHLTCDEQRPCTRCVKKGIAEQCVEGVRKKAKYLMEGEGEPLDDYPPAQTSVSPTSIPPPKAPRRPTSVSEQSYTQSLPMTTPPSLTQMQAQPPPPPQAQPQSAHGPIPQPPLPLPNPPNPAHSQIMPTLPPLEMDDDIWLAPQMMANNQVDPDSPGLGGDRGLWGDANFFGNGSFDFGTSASNEYQMLDAMLNSMSPVFPFDLNGDPISLDSLQPPMQTNSYSIDHIPTSSSSYSMLGPQSTISPSHSHALSNPANTSPALISPSWPIAAPAPPAAPDTRVRSVSAGNVPWSEWTNQVTSGQASARGSLSGAGAEVSQGGPSGSGQTKQGNADAGPSVWTGASRSGRPRTGAEVYHSVIKPFDYTEGYHRLMEHISHNFQQKEVLRVVKALAAFRPSLIALQMPMSEEDEVFLERSFQRTLIELEKLISYSATPTAVWRRTGDLVYANPEFCALVGKQQDDLLSGRTYIYHLFAKHTAISYWENFSVHAFENTTQNFFQSATLEVGDVQLACSCCFTIRRDVFDLPSVVIGQFLPVPSDA